MSDVVVLSSSSPVQVVSTDTSAPGAIGPQGPAGDVAKSITRTAMAGEATGANLTRQLIEAGREGVFVFSTANLSAQVTADPAQGVYVAPTSDATGASGAWMRATGPDLGLNAEWFGLSTAGTAAANATALGAAFAAANALARKHITIPPRSYTSNAVAALAGSDIVVSGPGATITSAITGLNYLFAVTGNRNKIDGIKFVSTTNHQDPWIVDVQGTDCEFIRLNFEKSDADASGKYFAYVRSSATGFRQSGCFAKNFGGIFNEASNSSIIDNRFILQTGGDDAIALKGASSFCRNVRVANNFVANAAAIVSLGSEVGISGANDATYSQGIGGVVVDGNTGLNCSSIALIKPGAVAADYRDGTVEDVVISNNTLEDPLGTKFAVGIAIWVGRGARVRGITGRNNVIRARTMTTGARKAGALDIMFFNFASGTAEPSVSDIDLQIKFSDPYNGQSNHASRPGNPTPFFMTAEQEVAGTGVLSNVVLDLDCNGCETAGVVVQADFDDAITFQKLRLTNTNNTSGALGGFWTNSRVRVVDAHIAPLAGNAYVLGATGEVVSCVDQVYWIGLVAAGDPDIQAPWFSPRRCFVSKIEATVDEAIAQSDANYSTFTLRNAGDAFHLPTTKATGGTASAPTLNLTANTLVTMLDSRSVTDPTNLSRTFFVKDARLQVNKAETGTGAKVRNGRLRIHWAPY